MLVWLSEAFLKKIFFRSVHDMDVLFDFSKKSAPNDGGMECSETSLLRLNLVFLQFMDGQSAIITMKNGQTHTQTHTKINRKRTTSQRRRVSSKAPVSWFENLSFSGRNSSQTFANMFDFQLKNMFNFWSW